LGGLRQVRHPPTEENVAENRARKLRRRNAARPPPDAGDDNPTAARAMVIPRDLSWF